MNVELTRSYVVYQAQTRMLELATDIAESRSLTKAEIKEKIDLVTKIRIWVKALQYYTYLEKTAIDQLVYTLADLCDANGIPYAPVVTSVAAPAILVGIPGSAGSTGAEGPEGGGIPFTSTNITIDTVVDSFDISVAGAAEWTIEILGTGGTSGKRVMRMLGGWSADGVSYDDDGGDGTDDIYGSTSPVTMSVVVTGTTAKLFATVTSGTWTIRGTRKYIPNNGNGISQPSSLANGKIWIGDSSNNPAAQTVSGDFTISTAGVGAINAGVIVDADINASAAIAVSKLIPQIGSRIAVYTASGFLTASTATATEAGYLSGVTSNIQTQLNSKLSAATGAISTVVSSDLTINRAVISNALGKIAVSNTTDTELGYVSGVTSAIQTQLNGKVNDTGDTMTGNLTIPDATAAGHAVNKNQLDGKVSKTGDVMTGSLEIQAGVRTRASGPYFDLIEYSIGAWDMDLNANLVIAHGLSATELTKVRGAFVVIFSDSFSIPEIIGVGGTNFINWDGKAQVTLGFNSTSLVLDRRNTPSAYDDAFYNDTSQSRGNITLLLSK